MMKTTNHIDLFTAKCERRGLLPVWISKNPTSGPGLAIGKHRRLYRVGIPGCYTQGVGRVSRSVALEWVYQHSALYWGGETFEPGFSKFKPRKHAKLMKLSRAFKEWSKVLDRYHD